MSLSLTQKIQGILFYKGEPMSKKALSDVLDISAEQLDEALEELSQTAKDAGLQLVQTGDMVELRTHPELDEVLAVFIKDERSAPLSKAALETLSIIAYTDGATKASIDYIRGVNATFILRNLLMRGLITKNPNPEDKRSPLYVATPDFLGHMGLGSIAELPQYEKVRQDITALQQEASSSE